MKWYKGDMLRAADEENCDIIAFTANSVLRKENDSYALVMGAGAALSVRQAYFGADYALGRRIASLSETPRGGVQPDYYVVSATVKDKLIMAVQVKRDWRGAGDWKLTEASLEALARYLEQHPDQKCVMNCPLIGLAGYAHLIDKVCEMVENILGHLNIVVCYFDPE